MFCGEIIMLKPDLENVNELIDLLIEIKDVLRRISPNLNLNDTQINFIKSNLIKIHTKLNIIDEKFGVLNSFQRNGQKNSKYLSKQLLFLVSSAKNRKKLINLGLDPNQIIATGGPINPEDIRILNPNITESNLKGINNKIEKFWKTIESKLNESNYNSIILLIENANLADQILSKRVNEIKTRLSHSVKVLTIPTFDLDSPRFLSQLDSEN